MANGKKISMLEYAKTIRHRVIGMTVEEWKDKVEKYYRNIKGRMLQELLKDMRSYLRMSAGRNIYGVEMPNIRSGNLIEKILTLKLNSVQAPSYSQQGDIHIAVIKVPYGIDYDNGNHSVLRMVGRNSPFPYAKALNEGDRFNRYNGFIEIIHSEFLNKYQKLSTEYTMKIFKEKYLK